MVHGLEAKYFGKMTFYYLDADDSATVKFQKQFGFAYQPEFYLLDGQGNLLKKWVGSVAQEEFEKEFASALGE
jgi:hypothetical protein